MIHKLFILFVLCLPQIVLADVYISEVAWMGNSESANYEWLELYSTESVSLDGWTLSAEDGVPSIALNGVIDGTVVLERNEASVPSLVGFPYAGALENGGEVLVLSDNEGNEIDRVDGSGGWSIGGDNDTKETLQKVQSVWKTGAATPGVVEVEEKAVTVETENASAGASGVYVYPTLTLSLPSAISVVAGSDIVFETIVGNTEGVQFFDASVVWNFGDGSSGNGTKLYHQYEYPGVYVLRVDARHGRDEISKRSIVTVRASNVVFSYIDVDAVRIQNIDSEELDISRWRVVSGSNIFQFPEHTYILPKESLTLSHLVSGFPFSNNVQLTFPNGKVVEVVESVKEVEVKYVPVYTERVIEETAEIPEVEEVHIQPAAAILAPQEGGGVSIWVYAWVVLVLLVGGTIVYIRRYV